MEINITIWYINNKRLSDVESRAVNFTQSRTKITVYKKKLINRYPSGSPKRNRTADFAVRGRRLNRLTMRPFVNA